ncbi:hypothetical protein GCK72_023790 [Caenorhabditis remanei]|uniref:DUF38 domain-containing protein n=1 Tax=Caenorhabditis remanei TaxID=31234 RepID=A0A6A5FXD6_CAERE|nr:hypothetical protein GCK72_023790 [Caenorhabditis remanei]KAF1747328.1 hypothetical protein GCK72_023790 [Caenorhabditis remanei]
MKNNPSSLLDVPELPMKKILSGINYTDQKHLRRTCKVVQPFLDEQVNVHETIGLHLILDDVKRCFKKAEANGEREPKKRKLESDEHYPWIDEAVELFQKLINKPDLKVKMVYITHEVSGKEPTEDQRKYFYQRIQDVFQGMKTKLNAERVELYVESPDFLLSILTKFQEGTLTDLVFSQYPKLMPVFDMKDIVVLPQWSGLRYLHTGAKLRARVADFKHIPSVIAGLEDITINEIKDVRSHIFNGQNVRMLSLTVDINKEEVEEAMQPFTLNNTISSAHRIILSIFPTVTLEEVQAFHANEHQSVETKTNPNSLLDVPEFPMKQILSGINYRDQKHLRRTCKVVQPFLDEKVNVNETIGLHLILDDVNRCFKKARANGKIETPRAKKRKLESDEHYPWIDEAVELFQKSINKPDFKVKMVYITHEVSKEKPTDEKKKYFYQRIQEVFQGMKTKLNAERVELYVESSDILLSILTKLQEGTLTELVFSQYPELMPVFDMKDIVILSQWSGLGYLHTHAKLRARVADFQHITSVTAGLEDITLNEIKDLRNVS